MKKTRGCQSTTSWKGVEGETRTLVPDLEPRSLLEPIAGADIGVSGGLT